MSSKLYTAFKNKLDNAKIIPIDDLKYMLSCKSNFTQLVNDYVAGHPGALQLPEEESEIKIQVINKLLESGVSIEEIQSLLKKGTNNTTVEVSEHMRAEVEKRASAEKPKGPPASKKTTPPPPPKPASSPTSNYEDDVQQILQLARYAYGVRSQFIPLTLEEKTRLSSDDIVQYERAVEAFEMHYATMTSIYQEVRQLYNTLTSTVVPPDEDTKKDSIADINDYLQQFRQQAELIEGDVYNLQEARMNIRPAVKNPPPPPSFSPPPHPPSPPDVAALILEIKAIERAMDALKSEFTSLTDTKGLTPATLNKYNDAVNGYNRSYEHIKSALDTAEIAEAALKATSMTAGQKSLHEGRIAKSLETSKQEEIEIKKYLNDITDAKDAINNERLPESLIPKSLKQGMDKVTALIAKIQKIKEDVDALKPGEYAGSHVVDGIKNAQADVAKRLLEAKAELKALDNLTSTASGMHAADLQRTVDAHVKKVRDLGREALYISQDAKALSVLNPYIIQQYKEAQSKVSKLETSLEKAEAKKHPTSDFFWVGGKSKRDEAWSVRDEIKTKQDELKSAEIDLARWANAKTVYEIEQGNIKSQKLTVASLEVELNALIGPPPTAPAADIENKRAQLAGAQALLKGSQSAIESLMRSFNGAGPLGKTTTLVLERGDNNLGFHSQVVERTEVTQVLKSLNIDTAEGDASVSITAKGGEDLYYLNTPVKDTEVIMSTKTYEPGVQACIVQSKNATVDRSIGITDAQRDEIAMQTALMFILNRGKGNSITIRGKDDVQIQKVHATLLWMQRLPQNDLKTICKDLLKREWPKQSSLDISKLEIISKAPGPEAAGWGVLAKRQKGQDEAFISEHMPGLTNPSSSFKPRLMDIKDELKPLKDPKDTQEIYGPTIRRGPGG